jgi:hypothetical protein
VGNALSATLTASTGQTVSGAEYWIDSGAHTAITGTYGTLSATVSATLTLPSGSHVLFVRGQDNAGTWGPPKSTTFAVDTAGPTTAGMTLTPNPSNGTVAVALHATGDDTATGGSNIAAAEYFIGATGANGTGTAMTVNVAAPVASLDATIAPPVSGGVISVHSKDALGNWGAFSTITLSIVGTGPSTSGVSATVSPNNGTIPLNSTQAVVRIAATLTSTGATVAGAEAFIDCNPPALTPLTCPSGSGLPFVPADGVWNSASEAAYGDIPLSTVAGLSNGTHTIYVHGRDATGNWGATSTTTLVIDKTAPTVSVSAAASTVAFGSAVTVNVTANDVGAGLSTGPNARQYWVDGSATPPANPTAFTGASFNVTGLTGGAHTIYVRVQDAASNWSTVASVTVNVVQAVNDTRSFNANTSATQTSDANSGAGVLANDLPTGAGRTARLASAPGRTGGTGAGTITVTCQGGGGNTAATPAIGGNTICTNGAYRVTLTGVGSTAAAIQASKRGTYQFTYTEIWNGVTSDATVTITVN